MPIWIVRALFPGGVTWHARRKLALGLDEPAPTFS